MLVRRVPPRADVHLVDGHGRVERVVLTSLGHPVVVTPVVGQIPHDRCRAGRLFGEEREGIGLVREVLPDAGLDPVLVPGAGLDAGERRVPDARRALDLERTTAWIP